MDLQTRKLNAIGYLIKLQDEKILKKIEDTIVKTHPSKSAKIKTLTKKQLIDRAKRANADYKAGRYMTQDQLELESQSWQEMKVIWSNFAIEILHEAYIYYKEIASKRLRII